MIVEVKPVFAHSTGALIGKQAVGVDCAGSWFSDWLNDGRGRSRGSSCSGWPNGPCVSGRRRGLFENTASFGSEGVYADALKTIELGLIHDCTPNDDSFASSLVIRKEPSSTPHTDIIPDKVAANDATTDTLTSRQGFPCLTLPTYSFLHGLAPWKDTDTLAIDCEGVVEALNASAEHWYTAVGVKTAAIVELQGRNTLQAAPASLVELGALGLSLHTRALVWVVAFETKTTCSVCSSQPAAFDAVGSR